ncbi:MAG TPA: hypothetical protein VK638_23315 [Edaphobacter sp.]|nr:hypothetical protein [Edaphobacter sp.]
MTTSSSQGDVTQSYLLHANSYIHKPVDLDGFLHVIRSIDNFWLSVVRLPREHTHDAKLVGIMIDHRHFNTRAAS